MYINYKEIFFISYEYKCTIKPILEYILLLLRSIKNQYSKNKKVKKDRLTEELCKIYTGYYLNNKTIRVSFLPSFTKLRRLHIAVKV